jgi:hypothetical protein
MGQNPGSGVVAPRGRPAAWPKTAQRVEAESAKTAEIEIGAASKCISALRSADARAKHPLQRMARRDDDIKTC